MCLAPVVQRPGAEPGHRKHHPADIALQPQGGHGAKRGNASRVVPERLEAKVVEGVLAPPSANGDGLERSGRRRKYKNDGLQAARRFWIDENFFLDANLGEE